MPEPPRRGATLRRRLAAAALGVLGAAAAAETVLRITHWGVYEPRRFDYHFLRRGDQAYWVFDRDAPPEHVWDRDPYGRLPPGARATYAINSYGLRGGEPAAGRPNVLFLGDSFTFGEGLPDDATFPARVERALAARTPRPQSINAGVPGYGSVEEAARLPELLEQFRPRAVVLVFVPNDAIPLDDSLAANDLLSVGQDAPPVRLAVLIQRVSARGDADRASEEWYASYYFGARKDRWDKARAALADMKRRCDAAGATFGVVLYPLLHRLSDRPFQRIHDTVGAACREFGAPVLDLTPALAREPDRALWLHPTDHHPDARANEIAAEAIAPFVETLLR